MDTTTHYIAVSAESKTALSDIVHSPPIVHNEKYQIRKNTRQHCSKFILTSPLTQVQFSALQIELPTYAFREQILSSIDTNRVTIISAETGSGKSTQVPQYIMAKHSELNRHCRIVCILPKRLAVKTIAKQVAAECNSAIGHTVGYQVRLDDCTSPKSSLIFMTR